MEETFYKGINCFWKFCHLNQIQENKLVDQSCRLRTKLKDMKHWMHGFVEGKQRQEDLNMTVAIQNFGENLQQKPYASDIY